MLACVVDVIFACDHALPLYLCNLFSGGRHDTILSQITCKQARIWTFFWLDRKQYGLFALFRLAKMPPSVSCCHRILKSCRQKFTDHLIPATSYRSDKRVHFSNNQFMIGILIWFDCNSSFRNLRIILSDLRFHSFSFSFSLLFCHKLYKSKEI